MGMASLADLLLSQRSPLGNRGDYNIDTINGTPVLPYYDPKKTDYDYEGYVQKYGMPDQSKGQHLTDEFKLPNHITFSTGSRYSNPQMQGGYWSGLGGESDQWQFQPSPFNLKQHSLADLIDYFNNYERKGTKLMKNGRSIAEGTR